MNGEWRIKFDANNPRLESPVLCWLAATAPFIELEMASTGPATTIRILWKRLDEDKYDTKKTLDLKLSSDRNFHFYRAHLASSPDYRDLVTGITIEPVAQSGLQAELAIKSISLLATSK